MPFLHLMTNMSKDKVTAETMNSLAQEMSVILGKDTKWINWVLDTDKLMSRVSHKNWKTKIIFEKCHSSKILVLDAKQWRYTLHLVGNSIHWIIWRSAKVPRHGAKNCWSPNQTYWRTKRKHSFTSQTCGSSRMCHEWSNFGLKNSSLNLTSKWFSK